MKEVNVKQALESGHFHISGLMMVKELDVASFNGNNVDEWMEDCYRYALYTLSEAWSGVNWADLMAAQGALGTDFYDTSTRTIVATML